MKTKTDLGVSSTSDTNISGSVSPGACHEAGHAVAAYHVGLPSVGVSADYYESFLSLSEDEMEILVRAVLNAQAGEARRIIRAQSFVADASARLTQFVIKTLSSVAVGVARLNHFAQLELVEPVSPELQPEIDAAVTEKIAKARPIIVWARAFAAVPPIKIMHSGIFPDFPSTLFSTANWQIDGQWKYEPVLISSNYKSIFPTTNWSILPGPMDTCICRCSANQDHAFCDFS